MAKAKHLKLELSMIVLAGVCFAAMTIAPVVALFERDWFYAFLLAVPFAFGSLPRRVRPWSRGSRIRLQHLYAIAVGLFGLGTGHVWLAVAGVLAPHLILLAGLWFIALAPQLFAQPGDVSAEKSPPTGVV